ncbi:MAG TPA: hypothetical protein VKB02_00830 [Pyrinomonadaceae bacterium]|nr:hypothetical protein [Pyrinomonadaceae bacterium]
MTQLDFKQKSHLHPDLLDPVAANLDDDKLLGRWINTNWETRGIRECTVTRDGEGLSVSIVGAGEDEPVHWPTARATPLANLEEEAGQRTMALTATFDLGFMRVDTHLRINKGVFVIVLFATFTDDSGRANYLNREFFYRHA